MPLTVSRGDERQRLTIAAAERLGIEARQRRAIEFLLLTSGRRRQNMVRHGSDAEEAIPRSFLLPPPILPSFRSTAA
jgi:hypothetical protein